MPPTQRSLELRRVALPGDPDDAALSTLEIAGDGRAIVLLHGLTGHRDDFRPVLPALAEGNDHRWLAPDLRGHGDFTRPVRTESFAFDALVTDLLRLAEALGLDRFDLLGHSFGGMVAVRFALAEPDRLRSLVLLGTSPDCPDGYDRAVFEKVGAIALARGMAFVQERIESAGRDQTDLSPSDRQCRKWGEAYWEHQRLRYAAMDPAAYAPLGLTMVEQVPVTGRLGEIHLPTTVLVGEDDVEFLRGADLLAAGIPGAVRETLPDAGHHPHRENTEAWLAAMRAHWKRTDDD